MIVQMLFYLVSTGIHHTFVDIVHNIDNTPLIFLGSRHRVKDNGRLVDWDNLFNIQSNMRILCLVMLVGLKNDRDHQKCNGANILHIEDEQKQKHTYYYIGLWFMMIDGWLKGGHAAQYNGICHH